MKFAGFIIIDAILVVALIGQAPKVETKTEVKVAPVAQPAPAKPVAPLAAPTAQIGKVVTGLPKPLPKPLPDPPKDHKPPDRKDGRWHWHPNYGRYVLIPVAVTYPQLVLPHDYRLPSSAVWWDHQYQAVGNLTFNCPNCGRLCVVSVAN